MLTKSILTVAAIALAASLGSASAGEEFSTPDSSFIEPVSAFATLNGMTTEPMNRAEMGAIRGADGTLVEVKLDGETVFSDVLPVFTDQAKICVTVTSGAGVNLDGGNC